MRARANAPAWCGLAGPLILLVGGACVRADWIGELPDRGATAERTGRDSGPAPKLINHNVTYFGWPDNIPPGNEITYPIIHSVAGGVGTFDDPITFGSDPTEWPPGTKLYVPYIQRYVIMEDSCSECISDWSSKKYRIAIWVNSDSGCSTQVIACESTLTMSSADVEANPPANRAVATQPLFNTSTCSCIQ